MTRRARAAFTRWLGGDVANVDLLRGWFARSSKGRVKLEFERRQGPQVGFDADMFYPFFLLMVLFASLLAAAAVAYFGARIGAWIVGLTHAATLLIFLPVTGLTKLLDDEDERVIGWWPVSRRDVGLARLGLVLEPALRLSLAATTAPLLALVVVGRPPVGAAVLLTVGLLLQTTLIVIGLSIAANALRRRWGVDRTKVVLQFTATGTGASFVLLQPILERLPAAVFSGDPWYVMLSPVGWAASWGLVFVTPTAWFGIGASLVAVAVVGRVCLPRLLPGDRGVQLRPALTLRLGRPVGRLFEWLLTPFATGREGWVMRRLTCAHLRDDPYAVASLILVPLLMAAQGAYLVQSLPLTYLAEAPDGVPFRFNFLLLLPALLLPVMIVPGLVYSNSNRAIWVVAVGDLFGRRMLGAQRGIARALSLAPFVVCVVLLHARAGTSAANVIADIALIVPVWELSCAVVQRVYPILPFSRSRHGGGMELLVVSVLLLPAWVLLSVWTAGIYEHLPYWSGKALTWVALALLVAQQRRALHTRIGKRALPLDLA